MIIGVAGRAGVGKSTLAEHIALKHGFVEYNFADPLKQMLEVIGIDTLNKSATPAGLGVTVRELLQTLGTDWGRNTVSEDFWIRIACQKVGGNTVIGDVRFQNEVDWILSRGGLVLGVHREMDGSDHHASENQALSRVKWVSNNSSLADFFRAADFVISEYCASMR